MYISSIYTPAYISIHTVYEYLIKHTHVLTLFIDLRQKTALKYEKKRHKFVPYVVTLLCKCKDSQLTQRVNIQY